MKIARHGLEVQPAENQRKCDPHSNDAAPHDQQMRDAAHPIARQDEAVDDNVVEDTLDPGHQVTPASAAPEEDLPASLPVDRRGRALQPHGVAVGQAKGCKEDSECIGNQSSIEMG